MTFERDVSCSACGRIILASERTREGAYDCPYCGIGCGTGVRPGDDLDDPLRFADAEAVFEEPRRVCPGHHGMTCDTLGREGVRWPCYEEGDEGDRYPYKGSFDTESGPGHIEGVRRQPPREVPDEGYPFVLTTARPEEHYDTGTMSSGRRR